MNNAKVEILKSRARAEELAKKEAEIKFLQREMTELRAKMRQPVIDPSSSEFLKQNILRLVDEFAKASSFTLCLLRS